MRVGSLCSGYGGLDLAVEQLWPCAIPAWHSEVDPWASKVLAHHWPDTPNLGDLTTVDWGSVAPVDVLTAGYPCQPFSTAGRRKGEDDDRHLWPGVLRAVRDLRPRLVLLENVAGHLSLGFGRVLGDLAEAGYVGSWTCLRASDVGACHRRERVFIAASDADRGHLDWRPTPGLERQARSPVGFDAHPHGEGREVGHGLPQPWRGAGPVQSVGVAADTDVEPAERHSRTASRPQGTDAGDGAAAPAHADECEHAWRGAASRTGLGCGTQSFGAYQPAVDRWAAIVGRLAPPRLDDGRLSARFVEWMMGLPEGWVTDVVPRRHALRILGNGVVPAQAAAAYRALVASLEVAA